LYSFYYCFPGTKVRTLTCARACDTCAARSALARSSSASRSFSFSRATRTCSSVRMLVILYHLPLTGTKVQILLSHATRTCSSVRMQVILCHLPLYWYKSTNTAADTLRVHSSPERSSSASIVFSLLLLSWYKSTNTDADTLRTLCATRTCSSVYSVYYCFPGTKVQILTQTH
jgi:hypothetical protein